jgi:sRNA-binding regulator protein Hfq
MHSDSTIYTIGTALNRARDNGIPVQVLVEGQWMAGDVVAVDGHGLVLNSEELEHSVIRMADVSAVRVFTEAPHRRPVEPVAAVSPVAPVVPVPTPRAASV